ncbi:MAG TPA: TonB family protein [Bacteroidia bacterium]|nr:TonB family protein [Bacteroidia bacterium]
MTKFQIKNPCPENWEGMKLGLHARFCENCKKDVIDFTNKSREEILRYVLSNRDNQICGRLYPSQLDFSHTDILVVIEGLSQKQKKSNLPFYLLSVGTMILASCNNPAPNSNSTKIQKDSLITISKKDSTEKKVSADTSQHKIPNSKINQDLPAVSGMINVGSDTEKVNDTYIIVEKMPEFVGGTDSLFSYLQTNTKYPKWEQENGIQGTVYVSFVISKTGKIINSKILRSVSGSKNFDAEALRVINNMPNWKPGEHNNKPVNVIYQIPIKFILR